MFLLSSSPQSSPSPSLKSSTSLSLQHGAGQLVHQLHQIPPHRLPLSLLSTSPLPAHSTLLRWQLLSALHTPLLLSIVPSVAPPPCHYRVPTTPTPLPSFPHRFPDYSISAPLFPCLCVMSGIVHIKASLLLLWRAPLSLSLQLLSLLTPIRLTHSPTFQCDHFPSVRHNQGCRSYCRSPPFSPLHTHLRPGPVAPLTSMTWHESYCVLC